MANEVSITVTGHDKTGSVFANIRKGISDTMDKARGDSEKSGKSIGSTLMSNMASAVMEAGSAVASSIGNVFSGAMSGIASTPGVGPAVIVGVAALAAIAGPALGAALAGGIVLGMGAGLVGVGVGLLMEQEKVKKSFEATGKEIKATMTQAFEPLLPMLTTVQDVAKGLAKEFAPVIESAMSLASGPLSAFVKNLGTAFGELKPAIEPLMAAFSGLLGSIGPQLPGVFKSISNSLQNLFKSVLENKDVIAGVFIALLSVIPPIIDVIGFLVRRFGDVVEGARLIGDGFGLAFAQVKIAMATVVEVIAEGVRAIGEVLQNIPGMEDFGKSMVAGADVVINKMKDIKREAETAKIDIKISADIRELQRHLDIANAALADPNLTKERRAKLIGDIEQLTMAQARGIQLLSDPKLTKEYVAKLNADKSNLMTQLAEATKALKDPDLTKERKAKLNADIAQLKAQIAIANGALASVKSKVVTVTVKYTETGRSVINNIPSTGAYDRAHGGIVGGGISAFANGGIAGASGAVAMVGEHGPELVRLPYGSSVVPAGQTASTLSHGGAGGLNVNIYVQGSIRSDRDLVNIIRDEFVNGGFRGAVPA